MAIIVRVSSSTAYSYENGVYINVLDNGALTISDQSSIIAAHPAGSWYDAYPDEGRERLSV